MYAVMPMSPPGSELIVTAQMSSAAMCMQVAFDLTTQCGKADAQWNLQMDKSEMEPQPDIEMACYSTQESTGFPGQPLVSEVVTRQPPNGWRRE